MNVETDPLPTSGWIYYLTAEIDIFLEELTSKSRDMKDSKKHVDRQTTLQKARELIIASGDMLDKEYLCDQEQREALHNLQEVSNKLYKPYLDAAHEAKETERDIQQRNIQELESLSASRNRFSTRKPTGSSTDQTFSGKSLWRSMSSSVQKRSADYSGL